MRFDLGRGVVVEEAAQEDVDYVEANYREGDRRGWEALGARPTRVSDFESCWAVRKDGMLIGYFGVALPADETWFGSRRWLCYMSCANADRIKLTYVKRSRDVLKAVVSAVPGHVAVFNSAPLKGYAGSVRWHERVLKMRRVREAEYKGTEFVVFEITRKEVEG